MGSAREILFEFQVLRGSVRATAIDPATGVEVTVVGPSTALQSDLERIAARKLLRALAKRAASRSDAGRAEGDDAGEDKPGIIT